MKKIYLAMLLLVSVYGYSQEVKFGVRGGYNISNLDFDTPITVENIHRNGIFIGFLAEIGLSKGIAFMPEIQLSAEGAKDEDLQLDYLQMPLYFKFRLSEKFHVGLGPQVGLKSHKFEDGLRDWAYSGVGGLEFKLSHTLFLDARYTYGVVNIFDKDLGDEAINTNIQLGIGYKF
ncbi:porin family protein [Siansivirga zeaxanthinifaciens]|nr:porin family protein [Siansivirga zeaxanthinifaciens]